MKKSEFTELVNNIDKLIGELHLFRGVSKKIYEHNIAQHHEIKRLKNIISNGSNGTGSRQRTLNITTRIGAVLDGLGRKQKD